jgi:LacI family transcriptional regulator
MIKNRAISQQKIASDLGVSQALVSLVLNGKKENISEDSYERIWKYAVRRGYRPKGMQTNGNHLLTPNAGFILRAGLRLYTQSNFFSHVQHGLHAALGELGCNTLFLGAEDDLDPDALTQRLERDQIFGLVIMGEVAERFLRRIRIPRHNIVSVSACYSGLCHSVMPNDRQSLELLVQDLFEAGHRRFAWLGGNKGLKQNGIRRLAMEAALEAKGLELDPDFVLDFSSGDRLDGRRAAQTILERAGRKGTPTAWICLNALMARGALNYLTQQGWQIPGQISVAAVDCTRVCVEEHPQITGANADPEKMGEKAGELLLQSRNSEEEALSDIVLPSKLTTRETTGQTAGLTLPR